LLHPGAPAQVDRLRRDVAGGGVLKAVAGGSNEHAALLNDGWVVRAAPF
jgi:hypothetical protein